MTSGAQDRLLVQVFKKPRHTSAATEGQQEGAQGSPQGVPWVVQQRLERPRHPLVVTLRGMERQGPMLINLVGVFIDNQRLPILRHDKLSLNCSEQVVKNCSHRYE